MKLKGKNAISLIVLVITVIILSILAATVIMSLSNTNIISEANDAVKKANEKQIEEAKTLMYADGMLGNNPEDMTIGDYTFTWDNDKKEVVQKIGNYVIKEGAVIPTDFYYVGGTKDTGVVISDNSADENKGVDYTCVGNQFVWVPVDDYSKFVRGEAELNSNGIYKMTGTLVSGFVEPYTSNDWEVKEYNAMCASVEKYGGFYIARFEAGDGDATYGTNGVTQGERTDETNAHTVVSKKGAYVYSYVNWDNSVSLSQNMYKDSTSVVSTLCYGVQWDAAMNFVSDAEHNITDSSSWGNYGDDEIGRAIQKTGINEAWKAKNIYDLAGNVWEWTMEAYLTSGRVTRDIGDNFPRVFGRGANMYAYRGPMCRFSPYTLHCC